MIADESMPSHSFLRLLLALVLFAPLAAQDNIIHRIILKDGSYQLATKYEVKGDRVRYYSSEREEWEELPNSLVDWTATNKFEKERNTPTPEAVQLDKELEHEAEKEEATLPLVAPGLRLPEPTGVFLLDNFQGEPQIVELQQSAGDVNRNTKANIFRGAVNPIAGLKVTIELEGAHAKTQAHVEVPSLYIKPEDNEPEQPAQSSVEVDSTRPKTTQPQQPQQPQQPEGPVVPFDRFRIVKVEVKGNKRIVGNVKRQVTGKVNQEEHWVKTTIAGVTGGWLKLTPTESLAPGEYALVEMMGKEGMNLYLWDFGVNPKGAANANPWKPDARTPVPDDKAH